MRSQPDYDDIEEEENRLTGTMKQFTSSRGKDKVKDNNKKYGKYNTPPTDKRFPPNESKIPHANRARDTIAEDSCCTRCFFFLSFCYPGRRNYVNSCTRITFTCIVRRNTYTPDYIGTRAHSCRRRVAIGRDQRHTTDDVYVRFIYHYTTIPRVMITIHVIINTYLCE